MDYTVELNEDDQIVEVTASCLLNQNIRRRILLDIASRMSLASVSKALLDLQESTFDPDEPMTGALELTMFMRSIGIPPQSKLAFLYSEAERHRKYFENVAKMDGFNLRYFKDRTEALQWLNH